MHHQEISRGLIALAALGCVALVSASCDGSDHDPGSEPSSAPSTPTESTPTESTPTESTTAAVDSFAQEPEPGIFPEPDLCDPDSPRWAKLGERESLESDLGAAERVTATNANGQTFELTYIGSDDSLKEYLAANDEAKTCLEAQLLDPAPEVEPLPPLLETSVIDAIAQQAHQSRDELAAYRDAQTPAPSLRQIASHFRVRSQTVIDEVVDTASVTFPDVDPGTTEAAVEEVLDWEEASPLIGSWEQPSTDDEYEKVLSETDAILVQIEVADPKLDVPEPAGADDANLSISAVFDPNINKGQNVYYKPICAPDARVRLHARAGRMTAYLWRTTPKYADGGSRDAGVASVADPKALYHSSKPGRGTYDLLVKGKQNSSNYQLDSQFNVRWGHGC